jgi:hypothetical protein
MAILKFYTQTVKILILILIAICTSCETGSNAESKALSNQNPNLIIASIKYAPPPPPPPPPPSTNSGEPGDRRGGGAGRGCSPIALVPTTSDGNYLWGQTVSPRPQFWFALPRSLTKKDTVEFVLKDNQDKEVYKTTLTTETPRGIVNLTIPKHIPPLQTNIIYRWSFSVRCDAESLEDRPGTVQGIIQRVPISTKLKNQLAGAKTPIEQASIYAQNSIWFDALTTIAVNMGKQKTKDISETWNELLKQAKLEKVAKLPVVECCTADN